MLEVISGHVMSHRGKGRVVGALSSLFGRSSTHGVLKVAGR